jgi:hypothetical protein
MRGIMGGEGRRVNLMPTGKTTYTPAQKELHCNSIRARLLWIRTWPVGPESSSPDIQKVTSMTTTDIGAQQ